MNQNSATIYLYLQNFSGRTSDDRISESFIIGLNHNSSIPRGNKWVKLIRRSSGRGDIIKWSKAKFKYVTDLTQILNLYMYLTGL